MVDLVQDIGIDRLSKETNNMKINLWQQGWKKVELLGLENENAVILIAYVEDLVRIHIKIN